MQGKAYIEAFTDLLTSSAALGTGLSLPNEFTVRHYTSMGRFAQVHFLARRKQKEHGFCEVKLCLALQFLVGKAISSSTKRRDDVMATSFTL